MQCECQRFVVCEYMKVSAFKKMTEVFDHKIYSQQFPVKGIVACLSRCHILGEEGDGVPGTIDALLQDCSHSSVRCISHETCGGIRFGI